MLVKKPSIVLLSRTYTESGGAKAIRKLPLNSRLEKGIKIAAELGRQKPFEKLVQKFLKGKWHYTSAISFAASNDLFPLWAKLDPQGLKTAISSQDPTTVVYLTLIKVCEKISQEYALIGYKRRITELIISGSHDSLPELKEMKRSEFHKEAYILEEKYSTELKLIRDSKSKVHSKSESHGPSVSDWERKHGWAIVDGKKVRTWST